MPNSGGGVKGDGARELLAVDAGKAIKMLRSRSDTASAEAPDGLSRSFPHRLQLPGRNKTAKRFLDETDFSREALGMVSNPDGNGNGEAPPAPDGAVRFSRTRHPLDDALPERLRYMDRERGAKERAAFEYRRNMADRYAPVRDAVRDAIEAHGADAAAADRAALSSAASPYHAKRVQGGHAERDMARARAVEADLARDVAALGRLGLSVDDLGVWAYASHAKARNAQKLREGGARDGSGISDALADDVLSGRAFSLGDGAERRYTPEQARGDSLRRGGEVGKGPRRGSAGRGRGPRPCAARREATTSGEMRQPRFFSD